MRRPRRSAGRSRSPHRSGPSRLKPRRRPRARRRRGCRARTPRSRTGRSAHHLDQDHDPGDDRRRPAGVKAGHLEALGKRLCRQLGMHALDRSRARASSRGPRRGRMDRAPDRSPRARSACPRRRCPLARRAKSEPLRAPSISERTSLASVSSSPCSAGSWPMWRSVWRTVPAWSDAWNETSVPEPTTSSVEPPPMSTTSDVIGPRAVLDHAQIGEPSLVVAREDAGVERESLAKLAAERAAVLGVAHGRGCDRDGGVGLRGARSARGTRQRCRRRPRSPRSKAARTCRRRAQAGHGRAPLELGYLPVLLDVGDQKAGRVRAHIDDCYAHRAESSPVG